MPMSRAKRSKLTSDVVHAGCSPRRLVAADVAIRRVGLKKSFAPRSQIAILVDSGPLYAYIDEDDRDHVACLSLLESHEGPLVVPQLVITEVAYLLEGTFVTEPVLPGDWIRIAELVAAYHDLPLGTRRPVSRSHG